MENVVLLDETGSACGTAAKAVVHHGQTPLHLAFSAYLFNEAGQFLLTRRAESKLTWPGVWTNTCCGHPQPGEPVADSVRRRLRQELGIDTAELVLVLPRFRYQARMDNGVLENEVCPVYAAYSGAADEEEARLNGYAKPQERLYLVTAAQTPSPTPSPSPSPSPHTH